jgi:hypothetical protein
MNDIIFQLINEVKTTQEADIILEAAKRLAVKNQNFLLAARLRDIQHGMWRDKAGKGTSQPHGITESQFILTECPHPV